jgi:DNA-binding GntR family transcriptional regulator
MKKTLGNDRARGKGKGKVEYSMREKARLHIQRKIASRELESGSAISELVIAKELGISRTPVREAISQLVSEGLLLQVPSGGVAVAQLSRRDIIDLYELREALEVYAAGKAARLRVSAPDLERLQEFVDSVLTLKLELDKSGRPALDDSQMQRLVASDLAFHALLVRMAANARILKVVNETRLLIRIFAMHRDGHRIEELDRIHRYHSDVLRGVAEQDPELATRTLSEHIQASMLERLNEYDQWEREASLRDSIPPFFDVFEAMEAS